MGTEGTYLNIIKVIYNKHSKPYSKQWKTESISSEIRNKTRVPTLTIITQHNFGNPNYGNQRRKRINGIQIGKKEVKLYLQMTDSNRWLFTDTVHKKP